MNRKIKLLRETAKAMVFPLVLGGVAYVATGSFSVAAASVAILTFVLATVVVYNKFT